MSKVLHLDTGNFNEEVLNLKGVVLVDFWASWCNPCKMLSPILDEVSEVVEAKITKVNVDEVDELSNKYKIRTIPTMIIFKDGEVIDTKNGLVPKDVLIEKLNNY